MLELRLMHEWSSQVPQSFSTAWEFWQRQAPLIAFEHRYVLDSLLCLAALHAHRRQPQQWLTLEGRMVPATKEPTLTQAAHRPWTLPSEIEIPNTSDVRSRLRMDSLALDRQRSEMLRVARMYFERTLAGQNKALSAINAESGEACYLASICVTWAALFFLGEDQDDRNPWLSDPIQWVRIAHGSRVVVSPQIKTPFAHDRMHGKHMTLLSGINTMNQAMQTHADNHTDPPLGLLRRLGLAQFVRHLLWQTRHER
jgi:hypothetical protein